MHAGPLSRSWLCKIFNAIVNLEAIPPPGVIIPIYKGKGRDPLLPTSYRVITLTSVIAKTFEYSILDRMLPILRDRNLPQLTQTAYQHGVSCADATFSCQETISKYIRDGDSVYSCFYDLASAFDSGIPRPSQPSEEFRYIREGLAPHEGLVQGWALICPCGQNNLSCLRRQSRGPSRLSSLPYPLSTRHGPHPPRAQE